MNKSIVATLIAASIISGTANAEWSSSSSVDEMTGATKGFAFSSDASPTKPMGFPYGDVTAWIGFGCKNEGVHYPVYSEWVYIKFSGGLNLANTKTKSGYSKFTTRVKWDDKIEPTSFTKDWGSDAIHFEESSYSVGHKLAPHTVDYAINHILSSNTMLLEIKWHGEGIRYFKFSLAGSTKAIAKARADCGFTTKAATKSSAVSSVNPPNGFTTEEWLARLKAIDKQSSIN